MIRAVWWRWWQWYRRALAANPTRAHRRSMGPRRFQLSIEELENRQLLNAALVPPRGASLGPLSVGLSVQDGWGNAYTIPAGSLLADGRYHHLTAGLATPGRARYPLRRFGDAASEHVETPSLPRRAALLAGLLAQV